MSLFLAILVVVAFAALLERLNVAATARDASRRAGQVLEVVRDPDIDDQSKERQLRRSSIKLFGLAALIIGMSALAAIVPLAAVWALDGMGAVSASEVLEILQRGDFLLVALVLGSLAFFVFASARQR